MALLHNTTWKYQDNEKSPKDHKALTPAVTKSVKHI